MGLGANSSANTNKDITDNSGLQNGSSICIYMTALQINSIPAGL